MSLTKTEIKVACETARNYPTGRNPCDWFSKEIQNWSSIWEEVAKENLQFG